LGREFDLVFADAFKDYSVPFHLATIEFYRAVDSLLSADGLLLQNVIDELDEPVMLAALIATVSLVHAHVAVFVPTTDGLASGRSTFGLAAPRAPSESAATAAVAAEAGLQLVTMSPADVRFYLGDREPVVLADDFAPVESLVSHLYQRR